MAFIKSVTPKWVEPKLNSSSDKIKFHPRCFLTWCSTWCVILTRIVCSRRDWITFFFFFFLNQPIIASHDCSSVCLYYFFSCGWVSFCLLINDNLPRQMAICFFGGGPKWLRAFGAIIAETLKWLALYRSVPDAITRFHQTQKPTKFHVTPSIAFDELDTRERKKCVNAFTTFNICRT